MSVKKIIHKVAKAIASVALKSAKGSTREVSKEGMYQPKRPKM